MSPVMVTRYLLSETVRVLPSAITDFMMKFPAEGSMVISVPTGSSTASLISNTSVPDSTLIRSGASTLNVKTGRTSLVFTSMVRFVVTAVM